MSTPRCFPVRDILFALNFIHLPAKITGGQEARPRITLGNRILFCYDYYSEKKYITNF
jgi:hypothetical protein